MVAKSFTGGIHPPYRKVATAVPIEFLSVPKLLAIPLLQHIGKECHPVVAVGERVLMGQQIGGVGNSLAAPVHASVSGVVVAIEPRPHINGRQVNSIVIENDFLDEKHPSVLPKPHVDKLSPGELVAIIRELGVVGMGGGGFPTYAKLQGNSAHKIETVLLNGAECEPYLSDDHRIMVEFPDEVIYGLRCLMKASGASAGHIGVEENKPDALAALRLSAARYSDITVTSLAVKYPQGAELQLIHSCLGKEVPPGKLPVHVGVVVNNVHTAQAIARGMTTGMPSVERVVTVGGECVTSPGNLWVRVGATFADILAERGLTCTPYKLISGGPLMGMAVHTLEVAVTKCTSGILALSRQESSAPPVSACVRCAKCVDACPMFLQPTTLAHYAMKGRLEDAEMIGALDCRECGPCAYVCPAGIPLVQWIRLVKSDIYARKSR